MPWHRRAPALGQSAGAASATARIVAGIIALILWIGMALQFSASFERLGSVAETLWIMFRYFTIIANFLAALVLTGAALGRRQFGSPALLGGATLAMLLVGIVSGLLLRGLVVELSGGAKLADLLLHKVTTVLVPLFWLIFAPKGGLTRRDPWLWLLLPVAYFGYALTRGAVEGVYAYPFMDVARIGWLQMATNALPMALGFVAGGFALVGLDHWLARRTREE
ncbi:Pr6Pr family membrane protein [Methylocapsa sp. S129]|uniref:Pr6Pr family membrane protein n=1 Tax=Methylocapsa sp. S129 TaxID=1641869 RepID=UPI00131AA392|nr:Pr6Pr family membrane protein [Methylocapsa sp. S129]